MRSAIILLLISTVIWPSPADAFTSGLFRLLEVGGRDNATSTAVALTNIPVDLVVEAETYVPQFYRGRAEPTAGSVMRLTALPENTANVASYSWRVAGQVMSGNGQTLRVTAPTGTNEVEVDVSALDQNGNVIGRTTNFIPLSNPALSFYEVNPLRGISAIAIKNNLNLIGDEVTVRGEPYFANTISLSNLNGSWNTGRLENVPTSNWQTLTILRSDDVSNTNIILGVSNLKTLTETFSGGFILGI